MRLARLLAACCYVTTDLSGAARLERNRALILECLDRAAAYRPDFVVLPEIAVHFGVAPTKEAMPFAETLPGPTFEAVAQKARTLRSHVWLPLFERKDDLMHNSVALIGRDGGLMGVYRKYHATGYEIEDGVHPGSEVPVWATDCGRVGCAVCFDLKFPEVGLALSRGKANIVFWPSMFPGGHRLVAWAMDYGFYIVKCIAGSGAIVDPIGATVATDGPAIPLKHLDAVVRFTFAEVNTDRKAYHLDFNRDKLPAIVEKYGAGVQVAFCLPEGTFTLASFMADRTVEDIEREFALEDLRDYLDRAAAIRSRRLAERSGT